MKAETLLRKCTSAISSGAEDISLLVLCRRSTDEAIDGEEPSKPFLDKKSNASDIARIPSRSILPSLSSS